MTLAEVLILGAGGLALLLSAELVRSARRQRRVPQVEPAPSFRQVGTFGFVGTAGADAAPLPSTGRAHHGVAVVVSIGLFLVMAMVVKLGWDQAHPDIRSAYGRAYERCVTEEKISRWHVSEVQRCIGRDRSPWE